MIEKILMSIAWALPRQLAYWTFIRVATYRHGGPPDAITVLKAMQAWKK